MVKNWLSDVKEYLLQLNSSRWNLNIAVAQEVPQNRQLFSIVMEQYLGLLDRLPEPLEGTERRRYQRISVMLPVEFMGYHSDTGMKIEGQGILRNFSLSGALILVSEPPPLNLGQPLSLSIALPFPPANEIEPTHIQAHGEVVRLECPLEEKGCYGVAICFDESPAFFPSIEPHLSV